LAAIEGRMVELVKRRVPYHREVMPRAEARRLFGGMGQTFKVEIIDRLAPEGTSVGVYRTGDFVDLCRGPHVPDSGALRAVKLLRVAGVYWRGDERNPQLQRVYGTSWFSPADLAAYLDRLVEAARRDHRRLGRELEMFHFDASAPGMPYWLPNGVIVLNELIDFWRRDHRARGYHEVMTPLINEKALWETSGHWDHYRDDMFLFPVDEQTTYGLTAPGSCRSATRTSTRCTVSSARARCTGCCECASSCRTTPTSSSPRSRSRRSTRASLRSRASTTGSSTSSTLCGSARDPPTSWATRRPGTAPRPRCCASWRPTPAFPSPSRPARGPSTGPRSTS